MTVLPRIFTLFILLAVVSTARAQFTVETQTNPLILAQKILGEGVTILNAQYKGGDVSAATFNSLPGGFPLSSGIILTSGRAKTIGTGGGQRGVDGFANYNMGDALQASYSYPFPGPGGDADLTIYSTKPTFDAAVLEFDFIPQGDSINVRYVFGSEEYPDYTCTRFNDVFAFLITGPGFATPTNIALVPETNIPVSVNSINDGVPGGGGHIDTCRKMGGASPYTQYYVSNQGGVVLTYNGRTVVLTAKAKVQPCQVYHIKLAIADADDRILDSGVFIEAGSFSSNPEFKPSFPGAMVDADNNVMLVEACKSADLRLERAPGTSGPFSVNITYGGNATPGTDFTAIPGQIDFAANENIKTFPIAAFADAFNEGTERLVMYFSKGLACSQELADSIVIVIKDSLIIPSKKDTFLCTSAPVIIKSKDPVPNTTNTYLWNNGSTTQSILVSQAATYYVSHTYSQRCVNIDTFVVRNMDPTLSMPAIDPVVCDGSPLTITVNTNADSIWWNTGATTNTINVTTAGSYWVRVKNTSGCVLADTIAVTERPSPVLELGSDTAICPDETIFLNAVYPGATYVWNTGATSPTINVSTPGTYFVTSTLNGCNSRDTIVVDSKKIALADAGKDLVMVQNAGIQLNAAQHADNAIYLWSPSFSLNNPSIPNPVANPAAATEYTLRVTSVDGCVATDKLWVTIEYPLNIPNAFSPNGDNINDRWNIGNIGFYPDSRVSVYNRHGQQLFLSRGYTKPWDGTYNGKPLEPATYYYVIEPGDGRRFGGWIVLLK